MHLIFQEVYAALIVYNFTEWITAQVIVHESKRKHTYKVNFSADTTGIFMPSKSLLTQRKTGFCLNCSSQ